MIACAPLAVKMTAFRQSRNPFLDAVGLWFPDPIIMISGFCLFYSCLYTKKSRVLDQHGQFYYFRLRKDPKKKDS